MVGDDPRAMQPTSVQSSSGQSDGADAESLTTVRSVPEGDRPETAAGQDPEMEAHVAALTKRQDLWLLKKGYWAKFWIVFAGPLFNLIFALLISIGAAWIYGARVPLDQPVIGYADPNDQAGKAGLQGGDRVVAVNGTIMESWEQLATTIRNGDGSPVLLKITREGTEQEISVLPTEFPAELLAVQGLPTDKKVYKIGIEPSSTTISLGFTAGITEGFWRTVRVTQLQVMGLVAMFTGDVSPKHISGPIGIFSIASSKASRGVEYLIGFMVFLSIALAIMNLLPIPILDGGHLVFFTIEALRGKPLPLKTQEVASQFGMIVLLLLMVVAFSNDIFNLIQRWTTN
jgi:regulator of sigma E protease